MFGKILTIQQRFESNSFQFGCSRDAREGNLEALNIESSKSMVEDEYLNEILIKLIISQTKTTMIQKCYMVVLMGLINVIDFNKITFLNLPVNIQLFTIRMNIFHDAGHQI